MTRAGLLLAFLAFTTPAAACISTYSSDIKEAKAAGDDQRMARITADAEQAHEKSPTLENANDLAVAWIITGRVQDGIALLREVDGRYPGNAVVASNLGMALELAGEHEEALRWIRESVNRDPEEHQGSEWVHVRILEARLGMAKDPNWLRKNSVLGWREGQRLPLDERSRPRTPPGILKAVRYQLQERLRFVSAPDPVVGDLYLSLGDLAYSFPGTVADIWERDELIISSYQEALRFGATRAVHAAARIDVAQKRLEEARPAIEAAAARDQEARNRALDRKQTESQRRSERAEAQQNRRWLALAAFGALGVFVGGYFFFRSRRDDAS